MYTKDEFTSELMICAFMDVLNQQLWDLEERILQMESKNEN